MSDFDNFMQYHSRFWLTYARRYEYWDLYTRPNAPSRNIEKIYTFGTVESVNYLHCSALSILWFIPKGVIDKEIYNKCKFHTILRT